MEAADQIIVLITSYGLQVLGAIAMLAAGWFASKWAKTFVLKTTAKVRSLDEMLRQFAASAVRYTILGFTVLAVLGQFGVETTSLIALLGAAGLAVGLALQGTLSHVASGVMLLLFRPFKIGDFIHVGGNSGTVAEISLFTTTLNTVDNVKIITPNGMVWDQSIMNYTANDTRRCDIDVGIGYGDDMQTAQKVILDVVSKDKRVLKDPAPQVVPTAYGASSVDLQIRAWTKTKDLWPTRFDLFVAVKNALDQKGIEIPFPQQVVTHVNAPVAEGEKKSSKKAA